MDLTICKGTVTPVPDGLGTHKAILFLHTLLSDPQVCCWESCETNPYLDELITLAELSLGIFRAGLEVLGRRFSTSSPSHAS